MNSSTKLKKYSVGLTTFSPVFIGTGEALSPYTDFVQIGDELVYINSKKLEEVLDKKDKSLIQEFVNGVRNKVNNNRSEFSLKGFITDRLKINLEQIEEKRVKIYGDIQKKQLRTFIKNAGKPYIPGSTIKGAIRTAVLYDWFLNNPNGKNIKEKIKKIIQSQEPNKEKSKKLKDIKEQVECFGNVSNDKFRYLRVSDTNFVSMDFIEINVVERAFLPGQTKKENKIPQWSETLKTGTNLNFSISIEPNHNDNFPFLKEGLLNGLFERINAFSLSSIKNEIKSIENAKDFSNILSFYKDLEKQIKSSNKNEAIMRLGGGKTYFDNSIGLIIKNEDNDLFEKFRNILNLGKRNPPFPLTRSVILRNNGIFCPLGWVKITTE